VAWNKVTGNRYTCPAIVITVMNLGIPLNAKKNLEKLRNYEIL
jgi:hypothetical protein